MATVNISLPDKLKQQADSLVKKGYYASLSDLMRHGVRTIVSQQEILSDIQQSQKEFDAGQGKPLHTLKDLR